MRRFAASALVLAGLWTLGIWGETAAPPPPADPGAAPMAVAAVVSSTSSVALPPLPEPTPLTNVPGPTLPALPVVPIQAAPPVGASGEALYAGLVDLAQMTLVGDHYEVPLADGRRVVLTLDPDAQRAAERVLTTSRAPRGAIVAIGRQGRVLALAGRRADVPTGSTEGQSDWRLATDVWAPAASIFKLVTAAALVDTGVEPGDRVCFHGGVRSVTDSNLTDGKLDRRCENLTFGVAHSQNAIMGKLAHKHLNADRLTAMADRLQFVGHARTTSVLPTTYGKLALPSEPLPFAKAAAGFEGSALSALGGAMLADVFARQGQAHPPHLIARVLDPAGNVLETFTPADADERVDPRLARKVASMMKATCERGSAAKAFARRPTYTVAGKTGTLDDDAPAAPGEGTQYSWFVGFAPYEDPEVAIAVVLGNAESWWLKAHTAARMLLDAMLSPPRRT